MTDTDAGRPWLVSFGTGADAAVRLIRFPHAGGGASTFQPWSVALRPDVDVRALQLPGRETRLREAPVRDLEVILTAAADAVAALADRPFVFFGHSLGALLAYEVARRLEQCGGPSPAALVVSGRGSPELPSRAERLAHLPAAALVRRVADLYGGIPDVLLNEPDLVAMMGRVLQADLEILEHYRHGDGELLGCPVLAVGGSVDHLVDEQELRAWAGRTRVAFSAEQFAGDHFYFRNAGSRTLLLAHLRERCAAAAGRPLSEGHIGPT